MDLLTTENRYRTQKTTVSFLAKLSPGLVFYNQMIRIVIRSATLAKKGMYTNDVWAMESLGVLRAMEKAGAVFDVENLDIVRNLKSPCVFIGNHMSTLETFVLPCIIQPYRDVTFVVKQSLIEYPVFKHVMISRNPIVVGRENPREDFKTVMEKGQALLSSNVSVIIFPQTTRSAVFDPKRFNTIGIKLAQRAGVPVVPVALKTDAWQNGKLIKDFGRILPEKTVHFHFGDPIQISGNGKREHEEIIQFIEHYLKSWN